MERERLSARHLAKLRLRAVLENVPVATQCVAAIARAAGLEDHVLYQIQLAVDEACANIVEHAYRDLEEGDMELVCSLGDGTFTVRVRDWGRGFDPNSVEEPDVAAPLEERSLGGLGLFLVRQVMDSVQFSFDNERGNELVMVKRLPGEG
jgi:anti-sigma regulatory factor (Ser/Thr protein kinase)